MSAFCYIIVMLSMFYCASKLVIGLMSLEILLRFKRILDFCPIIDLRHETKQDEFPNLDLLPIQN